ncbi:MAG: sialate O-acetylesterase [Planctomyces sp.]|nr:sialate O-acetylesterase [Planctomyces sp.]
MLRFFTAVACCVFVCSANVFGGLELPAMFSESMVLQREQPVKIWGWADAQSTVVVEMNGQTSKTQVGDDGRWSVTLSPMMAGGPYELKVTSGVESIAIRDVLIGEVWLCSGQSNMAMTVTGVENSAEEIGTAELPQIRMFFVKSPHATEPQLRCEGSWSVCTPSSVPTFSATAFFFGRRLHQELNVPIGLINSSVGGTSIESWTSLEGQKNVHELQPRLEAWQQEDAAYSPDAAKREYERQVIAWEQHRIEAEGRGEKPRRRPQVAVQPHNNRNYPSNLFNGKIAPLAGYTLRGVIWYQGENAAYRGFSHLYQHQLRTLIRDWRTHWADDSLPFAWVQLPEFRAPQQEPSETTGWVQVQEGMKKCLTIPHTGMAVTIGLGAADDIHPRNKQEVGYRLAQWALSDVYGKTLVAMGPVYQSCERNGNQMVLTFDFAGEGLQSSTPELEGFAIAGPDRVFHWAKARLDGSKVTVWHDDVPDPQSVRYAWASNPKHSLRNSAGLPASPFRTDDWEEKVRQD